MTEKAFDKKLEKIADIKQKEKKMKKLTINPQVKGAFKLIVILALVGLGFYLGVQYQGNYNQSINSEVLKQVSQLKPQAQ